MDSQNRKTRSILINPKFQWTLIAYMVGITLLILLTIYGLFTFGFHQFTQMGTQAGLPADHIYFQFLQLQESTFGRVMVAMALVVSLILIFGGLAISHKIAGPIFRIQKAFSDMTERDPVELRKIQFREGDFFPELAESFNQLVEKWKRKSNE